MKLKVIYTEANRSFIDYFGLDKKAWLSLEKKDLWKHFKDIFMRKGKCWQEENSELSKKW